MKKIVMIGTSRATLGGISGVVRMLEAGGLFARWPILYIATHTDGGIGQKLWLASSGIARFLPRLALGRVALLHVHIASRFSFWRKSLFILPTLLLRVPVVVHLHGGEFHLFYEKECGPVRRRLVRAVFERAARVVALSESWRAWVRQQFPAADVRVIYNPVVVPVHGETPGISATVLFLGRLGPRKGVFDLLSVAAQLSGDIPDLKLWLGGHGDVEGARQRARDLGIEARVEFLGWVSGADKEIRLRQASVFALPSYNEGLPVAVLEAMSYGLPVIATPVGGIPEAITDGVEGYLVPPGDVTALSDRLRRLLSDADLRRRMGEAARAKVMRQFSTDVVVPRFEALYDEILLGRERV